MIVDHGKVVYAEKEPGKDVTVGGEGVLAWVGCADGGYLLGFGCRCGVGTAMTSLTV